MWFAYTNPVITANTARQGRLDFAPLQAARYAWDDTISTRLVCAFADGFWNDGAWLMRFGRAAQSIGQWGWSVV